MALCEAQLDSVMQLKREGGAGDSDGERDDTRRNGVYKTETDAAAMADLPLTVDFRSPVSHFVPPAVEFAMRARSDAAAGDSTSESPTPTKRKRGRPRVDKTSPEYLAKSAARKQAREMASVLNSSAESGGEKRKRGRPRVDKTSPDYLARKRARELESQDKRAKKQSKRRTTGAARGAHAAPTAPKPAARLRVSAAKLLRKGSQRAGNLRPPPKRSRFVRRKDSAASSSAGEGAARVKRKYTKRAGAANPPGRPRKDPNSAPSDRTKGKRGRPRKEHTAGTNQAKIRVRSNLMPVNSEPISLDSDDEPALGSPESLSLDENLRALRQLHDKYADLQRGCATTDKRAPARVEKLEDSSSGSDSSSSASGSNSSSSSSSSDSSSDSDSGSDSEPPQLTISERPRDGDGDGDGSASSSRSASPPRRAGSVSPRQSLSESENESADKPVQCRVCRKWYSTVVALKIHRRIHLNRGGERRSRDQRACSCDPQHHRPECGGRCSVCRGRLDSRGDKGGRVCACPRRGRAAAAAHACPQCGKRFHHAHSLARHALNHARQLFKCVVCKASFAEADQLAEHLNSHLANYKRLKP